MAKMPPKKFGGVNLIPVGVNFTFLRQDRPEVLIEFGEPKIITDPNFDRKEFTHKLEREFENFLDSQQASISAEVILKDTNIYIKKNSTGGAKLRAN